MRHGCCFDYECHNDLFLDWIKLKYVNDPKLKFATRGRWRFVLYSEYFTLANYRNYCRFSIEGQVDRPWNVHNRGHLPVCVESPLQKFIEKQYRINARKWHSDSSSLYASDPEEQKKWGEMKVEEILEHFNDFIEKRNAELMNDKEEDGAFQDRKQFVDDYNPKPEWRSVFDGTPTF